MQWFEKTEPKRVSDFIVAAFGLKIFTLCHHNYLESNLVCMVHYHHYWTSTNNSNTLVNFYIHITLSMTRFRSKTVRFPKYRLIRHRRKVPLSYRFVGIITKKNIIIELYKEHCLCYLEDPVSTLNGRLTQILVSELGHDRFRLWLVAWAPSQYKDRLIYVWRFPC